METLAMVMPVPGEKLDLLRETASTIGIKKRPEFIDFLKRYSIEVENWYLQPFGDMNLMICYLQGKDLQGSFSDLATSEHEFDLWVKKVNFDIFGIDFSQPSDGPMPEVLLEMNVHG